MYNVYTCLTLKEYVVKAQDMVNKYQNYTYKYAKQFADNKNILKINLTDNAIYSSIINYISGSENPIDVILLAYISGNANFPTFLKMTDSVWVNFYATRSPTIENFIIKFCSNKTCVNQIKNYTKNVLFSFFQYRYLVLTQKIIVDKYKQKYNLFKDNNCPG